MKISVLIPAYNAQKSIRDTIISLKNQKYDDLEIIVVNDGSTDNTAEVLNEFEGINLINIPNGGVSNARMTALKYASGDYVMFLDSDDQLSSNTISSLIKSAYKYTADIIQFRIRYKYENGVSRDEEPLFDDDFFIKKEDFKKNIYKKMMIGIKFNSLCRNMYKRELFCDLKFRNDMKTAEDLMMNIDVFTRATTFLYTHKCFYEYYISEGSLTGSSLSINEKIACNKKVAYKLLSMLDEWQMNNMWYRILIKSRLFIITILKIPMIIKSKFYKK